MGCWTIQQRVTIHVTHRIGAMVTALVLVVLACLLWRQRALRGVAAMMLLVLAGQIGLGITNVVASLPLSVAVAHNVTGVLLLLSLVAVNMQVYRMRQSGNYPNRIASRMGKLIGIWDKKACGLAKGGPGYGKESGCSKRGL